MGAQKVEIKERARHKRSPTSPKLSLMDFLKLETLRSVRSLIKPPGPYKWIEIIKPNRATTWNYCSDVILCKYMEIFAFFCLKVLALLMMKQTESGRQVSVDEKTFYYPSWIKICFVNLA